MDYTKLFYLLTVADKFRDLFLTGIIIFSVVCGFSWFYFLIEGSDDKNAARKARPWLFWTTPLAFLFWALYISVPTKKEALFIIAGGSTFNYISKDSTAAKIPKRVLNLIDSQLELYAEESKVKIKSLKEKPKEKKVEEMSKDELLELIKESALNKAKKEIEDL